MKQLSLFTYVLDWWASICVAVSWFVVVHRRITEGVARWTDANIQLLCLAVFCWSLRFCSSLYYWQMRYFAEDDIPVRTWITSAVSIGMFVGGLLHVRLATYPEFRNVVWLRCGMVAFVLAAALWWVDPEPY